MEVPEIFTIFAAKMKLINENIQKIFDLCKKYKVNYLYVFGSVLTPRFNADSDIDLLVDFKNVPPEEYADNYFDLKFQLSDLLGREIDLVEDKSIGNPFFRRSVDKSKHLIYG